MPDSAAREIDCDLLVVGAGVIGCAIAREVTKRGVRTVVLEARGIGGGATQASAGVLAPYIEAPSEGPLHTLTVESLALYDDFVAEVARESKVAIEYRRCGTLEVAHDATGEKHLKALAEWVTGKGITAKWLEPIEVSQCEPGLAPTRGGLLVPTHGYVHAMQLTTALTEAARRRGAEVHAGVRVEGIAAEGDYAVVKAGIRTYRAATVVIAAGSWSSELAAETTVTPVRGQLVRVRWEGPPLQRILWSEQCYLVPWVDGTLLIGATVEQVGFDERVTAAGVQGLLTAARAVLPPVANATYLDARVGLRPATPSGLPVIRRSAEHSAIVYATGHFRNGILLAPLTAKRVADLL